MRRIYSNAKYILLTIILLYVSSSCDNNSEKEYHDNGFLKSEYTYSKGKKHGLGKEYYANGQLKSETNWNKGNEIGVNRYYFKNGNLKAIKEIKNNSIVEITKFYKDGSKRLVSNLLNDLQHGFTAFYNVEGELYERIWFDQGEEVFLELRDSLGAKRFLRPEIELSQDTVEHNDTIKVKISFWDGLKGMRKLYSVTLNKDYSIGDTMLTGRINEFNVGEIEVIASKKGVNKFFILYNQEEIDNDTFPSANNLVSQFKVVVY